jgi:hypothetical protein
MLIVLEMKVFWIDILTLVAIFLSYLGLVQLNVPKSYGATIIM